MGDLSRRVREAADSTEDRDEALSPRHAAKAERLRAAEVRRVETARRTELAKILNTFRGAANDHRDVGTIGFIRFKQFKKRRIRLGRRPRGWIVGAAMVPVQLPEGIAEVETQLVLGIDGRLYASLDGQIGDRYQIGQAKPPITAWMLSTDVWRTVEDTIPETVGHLVGALELPWQPD